MATRQVKVIRWQPDAEKHDFQAAKSYLRLIYTEKHAAKMVAQLRAADITQFKAKDIFRASQLSLLGVSNSHLKKDRKKIQSGTRLSPLLLVRDDRNGKVVVADGYHRLCAIYAFDEDASIHCKII